MGKWLADRPTLRGFLIIALITLAVVVLNLYTAVLAIGMLLRIAFFLAIAFFIYLLWRERRDEIGAWSTRERVVFYGSALLIVGALGVYFWHGLPGYEQLGFIGVLGCAGYAMFRVWRDRHTYRV
jgi:small-conductance mechanosensitive channel